MRALAVATLGLFLACSTGADPMHYRLAHSGADWTASGDDPVLRDLKPRYPAFFAIVFDVSEEPGELNLLPLRDDLERQPVDRRNYDALNAVAIGYFELNAQAESLRGTGDAEYLGGSMRVAKLVAVPWRAYREIDDAALRDAILDFFADAASGDKPASKRTSTRLGAIVDSLEPRENDPARKARIRRISAQLR